MKKIFRYLLLGLGGFYLFASCSPYSHRPVDMLYHNTTSHYNAYFLAKERMKELETGLYTGYKDNYNRVLDIFPKIDSNFAKANKDKLDKIIKNASIPIQWHKYSHWVDDSYLIIGKCRYYDVDWDNALTTFRFINSRYEDNEVKHHALIWLMRTFMEQKEWDQARQWGDYLEEEYLSLPNVGRFSLANGAYYLKQGDLKNAFTKLKIGVKYVKPRDYRAKIYFILGQLGQRLNRDKDAYAYYRKCLKSNPHYELWFNAKINLYQMMELKNEKDAEKVLAFYRKMLKDAKNEDYKDKIYYEMGYFELKRENLDEALRYFSMVPKEAKASAFNKSFAYLRTADIFYDKRQMYERSKYYYDSTITLLEKDLPEYPRAFRRQRILKEFVEQLIIVRTEDSLQKLARMDSISLGNLVRGWVADDDIKRKNEEKQQARLESQAEADKLAQDNLVNNPLNPAIPSTASDDAEAKWYFNNNSLLASGRQDFAGKWGNRPLEDNWRRASKDKDEFTNPSSSTDQKKDSSQTNTDSLTKSKPVASAFDKQSQYYDKLPLTKVKMDSSMARLNRALFSLSRMYDFNLEEYKNAIRSYERYVNEFPDDDKSPQAMYAIYLICKNKSPDDSCMNVYRNRLLSQYPNSLYAKLIKNPNYLKENRLLGERIKFLYRNAFEMFENDRFLEAQNAVAMVMKEHPDNEFEDRFSLLRTLIIGKTQGIKSYQDSLEAFIYKYNKSHKLVAYAKDLLVKANNLASKQSSGLAEKRVVYNLDLDTTHYFSIVVPNKTVYNKLSEQYKIYNNEYYTDLKLKIQENKINDSVSLMTIKQFPNKIQALNYFEKQKAKSSPLNQFPEVSFSFFAISSTNYSIMTEEKNYSSYKEFFKKNYLH